MIKYYSIYITLKSSKWSVKPHCTRPWTQLVKEIELFISPFVAQTAGAREKEIQSRIVKFCCSDRNSTCSGNSKVVKYTDYCKSSTSVQWQMQKNSYMNELFPGISLLSSRELNCDPNSWWLTSISTEKQGKAQVHLSIVLWMKNRFCIGNIDSSCAESLQWKGLRALGNHMFWRPSYCWETYLNIFQSSVLKEACFHV